MPPKRVGKYVPLRMVRNASAVENSFGDDYYPGLDDPNFIENLITRKEFWKLRTQREPTSMEEKCKRGKPFRKLPHQEFLENYINVATPYNGVLVFQGVGSGKTGAAILVAMGFQDVLRRLHKGDRRQEKKKIMILTPGDKVQDNFKQEIFNFKKYFQTKKGLSPQQILQLEGESQQITGNRYMPDPEKARTSTAEQIIKSVSKKIKNDFEFMNHQAFANRIIALIGKNEAGELWNLKPETLDETQKKRINRRYRNRVMIIDEVHNIRDNENNIVPPVLEALVQNAENLRIVLLSATPMIDSPREIIYLLNLLLMNDRRPPLQIKDIFDKVGNFQPNGKKKLEEAALGYISYLRSETPDRFPVRLVPDGAQIIQPKYDWKGEELDKEQQMKYQKIYPIPLSADHYQQYHQAWTDYLNQNNTNQNNNNQNEENENKKNKNKNKSIEEREQEEDEEVMNEIVKQANEDGEETIETKQIKEEEGNSNKNKNQPEKEEQKQNVTKTKQERIQNQEQEGKRYMPFIYLSNIWLPCKDGSFATNKKEGFGKSDKEKGPFQEVIGQDRQGRKYSQYKLRGAWAYEKGVPFIDRSVLPKYSTKMAEIYDKVKGCRGIALVSSQWLAFGTWPMAMVLEKNGIQRFLDPDQPDRPLLETRTLKGGPREPICAYCGEVRAGKKHVPLKEAPALDDETYPGDKPHAFKEAKYALVTGETDFTRIQEVLMSPANKWGGEIKVIVGSDAIAEGVNTLYIRQVHIMEPRFNWSTMEQIVGRATRNCSHVALPPRDRNVDIYYWAAIPPTSAPAKQKETEMVNVRYYRRAELKDVRIKQVEYILKITAVDCFLNKNANLFLPKDLESWLGFKDGKMTIETSLGKKKTITVGDTPYSRVCDYRPTCDYQCIWEPKNPNQVKVNPATYTVEHAQSDVQKVKRIIRKLYQNHQRQFFTLPQIQAVVEGEMKQELAPEIIYQAVEELLHKNHTNQNKQPVELTDPFHRRGYLIYRGKHYVWQPMDIPNELIPIRARWEPLEEKPELFPLSKVEVNNLANKAEQKKNKEGMKKKGKSGTNNVKNAVDVIEQVITKAEESLNSWAQPYQEHPFVYDILVAMELDRMLRANFHYMILERILESLHQNPEDIWGDEWFPSMVNYYNWNWTSPVGPKQSPPKGFYWDGDIYRYGKDKKVEQVNETEKEFSSLIQSWTKHMNQVRPIVVQSSEDAERSGGRIWRSTVQLSGIFGMIEFFKGKEWIFKIVDTLKELGVQTVQKKKSKRSESRGKKCENFKLPELREAIQSIGLPIQPDEIVGKGSCKLVEFLLREFDLEKKNKKRWFITALEIYIMNPSEA
jgi:hypothetical protein